jgi:bifunctional non-homologous end joining protein LigD
MTARVLLILLKGASPRNPSSGIPPQFMQKLDMGTKTALEIGGRTLQVSNLDKILYPANRFTKGQIIDYYIKVSPYILPHLKNRPLTLKRYPDGITAEHFYEKDAPSYTPAWIKLATVPRKGREGDIRYVMINDVASLVWAANLASLEMHVFLARFPKIHRPNFIVFDLDPGEPANVLDCAQVSLWIRELLEKLGLQSFVKSSGSKGLQLYIPLNTASTYEKTQPFARAIAELMEKEHADRVESDMARSLREGKVFIDWSQNSDFKTTVCVYSLRAKHERPYVSMPFTWQEVEAACQRNDAAFFLLEPDAALKRLEKVGDLFEPVLKLKQKLPKEFEKVIVTAPPASSEPRLKGLGDHSIKAYEAKRDFKQTKEPAPKMAAGKDGKARLFVIQKHRASHLHYDFRLEMEGVLKSWAVPKGPPYVRAEKRLAMWVEDHPLDYARFEGIIAPGNYGAGTVMVWDIGTYELMDGSFGQGKLHLMLHGKKLQGEWILVRARRTGEQEKQPWFLIKGGDSMDPPRDADLSVLTGRSLEEIAGDADAEWKSNRKATPRPGRRRLLATR